LASAQLIEVDCDTCVMRATDACGDCLVTYICDREPDEAVIITIEELRAMRTLSDAGLVTMRADGRRRYYQLADPAVADVLDSVEGLAGLLQKRAAEPPAWDRETVHVRACLDHLAGRLGGRIAGALVDRGLVRHSSKGLDLTDDGASWLGSLGADVAALKAEPRKLIRLCPDWTGDLPHIGGSVGAAMLRGFVRNGWLRRLPGKHRVAITPMGVTAFRERLGLDVRETAP